MKVPAFVAPSFVDQARLSRWREETSALRLSVLFTIIDTLSARQFLNIVYQFFPHLVAKLRGLRCEETLFKVGDDVGKQDTLLAQIHLASPTGI